MKKKLAIGFIGLVSLSLTVVAGLVGNKTALSRADVECLHTGYHYEYLAPSFEADGHEEFWVCCKCHKVFLEEPETGTFIDQEDDLMIGEIGSEHPAYIAQKKIKPLNDEYRSYYPVFLNNNVPEGVHFYDANKEEINASSMDDISNARYYYNSSSSSFTAVASINNVSFNTAFGSDGTGSLFPTSQFLETYYINNDVMIEGITNDGSSVDAGGSDPLINGVSLSSIWNAYKVLGFGGEYGQFWSCVASSSIKAYAWKSSYAMWIQQNRSSSMNTSILLSRSFE